MILENRVSSGYFKTQDKKDCAQTLYYTLVSKVGLG